MLVGRDDVHIVNDGDAGVLPSPASVVISTRIKPGQEFTYRAWEQRIAAAQSKAPGFQGYRFEPPVPGVQDDWLAILRFDTETNSRHGSTRRNVRSCYRTRVPSPKNFTPASSAPVSTSGFPFRPAAPLLRRRGK
jgi:hypothetical protein